MEVFNTHRAKIADGRTDSRLQRRSAGRAMLAMILVATLHLLAAAPALAGETAFHFAPADIEQYRKSTAAAWNPVDVKLALSPGFKVFFFGRADKCSEDAANGPTANMGSPSFAMAHSLTGIPLSKKTRFRWAPSADMNQCSPQIRSEVSETFIHANEDSATGGIGIFSSVGPEPGGRHSFWQNYTRRGKNNTGLNASIMGTYMSIRLDHKRALEVTPWANPKCVAEFRTIQNVATCVTVAPKGPKTTNQAKQALIVVFRNAKCMETKVETHRSCAIQYVMNTAVCQSGVAGWSKLGWFNAADILVDHAQGGMPVLRGPLSAQGSMVKDAQTGLALYESTGEATQHGPFAATKFGMRVSFEQLKTSLRVAVSRVRHVPPVAVKDADVAAMFGESWNDQEQWYLAAVNFGQEVFSQEDNAHVYIGGGIKYLYIGPAN